MSEPDWQPLARSALVAGRKVIVAPKNILSEALRKSKLLQKARDEGSLRTLVDLFAGESATVIEAPPVSKSPLDIDGMCKIRTSVGTTASLPFGSIGVDPEAERQMKLKYEHNAAHDIAASEVQDIWRKCSLRRKALLIVKSLREAKEVMLMEQRMKELSRQELMVQNMAATTVQAAVRGKLTRNNLTSTSRNGQRKSENNNHIQQIMGKSTSENEEMAATRLESTFRGALYRKHELIDNDYMQHDDENNENMDINTKFLNACSSGDLHRVHSYYRDKGVNIHVADNKGNNGILCAIPGDHIDVIKFLQSVGGSLSMRNFTGWSALHRACFYGKLELSEYIINQLKKTTRTNSLRGVDDTLSPLSMVNHLGATPLHVAIPNGHKAVCEMLIHQGAPLECKNASGDTPLSFAVICRKPQLVSLLLKGGADVNTRNNEGLAPYEIADKLGQPEISKLLRPSTWNDNSKSTPMEKKETHTVFRPLVVPVVPNEPKSNNNNQRNVDKRTKEDGKAVDILLQHSSAVLSRREMVRKAWLSTCSPLCDLIKMRLHEVHTILHVLGLLPSPPDKTNLGLSSDPNMKLNKLINIRLDDIENTYEDLKKAGEILGVDTNNNNNHPLTLSHANKAKSKLLSLIQCPKGATVLIAERKKSSEMGDNIGKVLLQRLDLPDTVIAQLGTSGKDLIKINEKFINQTPILNQLPTVIKYRLLFHVELLKNLEKLEKKALNKNKKSFKKRQEQEMEYKDRNIDAVTKHELFDSDSHNTDRSDSKVIEKDISIQSGDDDEDGGWITLNNYEETLNNQSKIQVAHFEELVSCMASHTSKSTTINDGKQTSISSEELKIARRASSGKGKLIKQNELSAPQVLNDHSGKVFVQLENGLGSYDLPMKAVYIIPQVLTKAQLYIGANARVVKHGWLKQLFYYQSKDQFNTSLNKHDEQDNIIHRLGGALIVVKEIISNGENNDNNNGGGGGVKVQTADGYEAILPYDSLCPPPMDAALKLLFQRTATTNMGTTGNSYITNKSNQEEEDKSQSDNQSETLNFDKPRNTYKQSKPSSSSSFGKAGGNGGSKHVVNLNMEKANTKSSRPLYREVNEDDEEEDPMLYQRRLKPTKINNNPYVPEKMLGDARVNDQLGRRTSEGGGGGGGGRKDSTSKRNNNSSTNRVRPKTAGNARFGSTTRGSSGNFNEIHDDIGSKSNSSGGKSSSRNNEKKNVRPRSAQPNGRQSQASWTPLNVQTFDFKPAMPKKEKKKDKPEFKFGVGGGTRKSVDMRENSDLPSTTIGSRSQITSPRDISPLRGGGRKKTTRRFDNHNDIDDDYEDGDYDDGDFRPPKREYVQEPKQRMNKSTNRNNHRNNQRPVSAGVSRASGAYADASWSFGEGGKNHKGNAYHENVRSGLADTLRTTVTRQQQHAYDELEVDGDASPKPYLVDEEIRDHVEQMIFNQSNGGNNGINNNGSSNNGGWLGGGLESPNKRSQEFIHTSNGHEETDAIFREQLDRMEEQMARKEKQISEARDRQLKVKQENKESKVRIQRERSKQSKVIEQNHRKRREDLFKTDIAADVDRRINQEEQTWREAEYAASELAFAMDSLSESLQKDKGRELEIRRKIKSLNKRQYKLENRLAEIHSDMGLIKMSRNDSTSQVNALENEVNNMLSKHELIGKEIEQEESKLLLLRNNAQMATTQSSLGDDDVLDRDARLIHSIELKSSMLTNRRNELMQSSKEVEGLIKELLLRQQDLTSQLTIADVAIKAMKSVVGNFTATA